MSPPAPVTARPVETPGIAVRSTDSWKNFCRPSASRSSSVPRTTVPSASPAAIRVAAERISLPISRSSRRTPASRVYSEITARRIASETSTSSGRRPFRFSCRGSR
jgi:hypothetical protein